MCRFQASPKVDDGLYKSCSRTSHKLSKAHAQLRDVVDGIFVGYGHTPYAVPSFVGLKLCSA